jgi:formiminoglutamase
MSAQPPWLEVHEGDAPLLISFPHTGTDLPDDVAGRFVSPWLAQRDADWWVHELYAFARGLGATTVRSSISRSVIDLNRDPSGVSLYPGQNTTGLCPLTTFDNQPLYQRGQEPDEAEIMRRRDTYFAPYHDALASQIARLRARHGTVVVYDAHSIRSRIPAKSIRPATTRCPTWWRTCAS